MEKLKLDIQKFAEVTIGNATVGSSPNVHYYIYATVNESSRTVNSIKVDFVIRGKPGGNFALISDYLYGAMNINGVSTNGGVKADGILMHANSVAKGYYGINARNYATHTIDPWQNDTRYYPLNNVSVAVTGSQTSITNIKFVAYRVGSNTGGKGTIDCSNLTIPAFKSSFNLNILYPNGSEPYSTGDAGSINFSADGGSSWNRVYNEPASTYACGTNFQFKEFQPGTGLVLDAVTINGSAQNVSAGNWSYTQPDAGSTIVFQTAWQQHYLDLNGRLDGVDMGGISPCGTTSVTVDGTTTSNLTDYYQLVTYGKTYSIATPTVNNGYTCTGLVSGSSAQSGTMGTSNLNVRFNFTTNKPSSLSITRTSSTTTSISVSLSATGLNISNYTLYYRKSQVGSYTPIDLGTTKTTTVSNLEVDTDYQFYFTVTNPGGTTTSGTVTYSTTLNNPTITAPIVSNLLPFSCTITATGSVSPSRTLNYRFSKDNGSTWTSYQTSNSYNWTGLLEETTYNMKVQVKAIHVGTNASDTTATSSTISITTPADQAKISIKINGTWKKGKCWYKKNGTWVKAKKFYIKTNNTWKRNKN